MSFSFIDIEENKSRMIAVLFLILVLFYFVIAWLIYLPVKGLFLANLSGRFSLIPSQSETLVVLLAAMIIGGIHWRKSTRQMIEQLDRALNAQPADEEDNVHRRFLNVIQEASAAAGGKHIECRVLPSPALNAYAVADFNGRYVIGVTEGLLSKLNRAQLESVVGHELAHLVSGDSLMTSVSVSLFGVYAAMMKKIEFSLEQMVDGMENRSGSSLGSGRGGGQAILLIIMVYLILGITRPLVLVLNMFLSRQQEYRADAVAVRLTRNPVALAEALHIISRSWHGTFLPHEYLSAIFILNPASRSRDEQEGFLADLFSTHPPVAHRIEILTSMAGGNRFQMIESVEKQQQRRRKQKRDTRRVLPKPVQQWFVIGPDREWQGPHGIQELRTFPWFMPDTWVRQSADAPLRYASDEQEIHDMFRGRLKSVQNDACPHCAVSLDKIIYEEVPLQLCNRCGGILAEHGKIPRLFTREEQAFSDEIKRRTEMMSRQGHAHLIDRKDGSFQTAFEINCPRCEKKMHRRLFSYTYPVVVDYCRPCDLYWFDKDELEVLQCLYETMNIQDTDETAKGRKTGLNRL